MGPYPPQALARAEVFGQQVRWFTEALDRLWELVVRHVPLELGIAAMASDNGTTLSRNRDSFAAEPWGDGRAL